MIHKCESLGREYDPNYSLLGSRSFEGFGQKEVLVEAEFRVGSPRG
jgi:hypothetical protein